MIAYAAGSWYAGVRGGRTGNTISALAAISSSDDILATFGGSDKALQIVMSLLLDDGDEVLVPEPYYPNYDYVYRRLPALPSAPSPPRRRRAITMPTAAASSR